MDGAQATAAGHTISSRGLALVGLDRVTICSQKTVSVSQSVLNIRKNSRQGKRGRDNSRDFRGIRRKSLVRPGASLHATVNMRPPA